MICAVGSPLGLVQGRQVSSSRCACPVGRDGVAWQAGNASGLQQPAELLDARATGGRVCGRDCGMGAGWGDGEGGLAARRLLGQRRVGGAAMLAWMVGAGRRRCGCCWAAGVAAGEA